MSIANSTLKQAHAVCHFVTTPGATSSQADTNPDQLCTLMSAITVEHAALAKSGVQQNRLLNSLRDLVAVAAATAQQQAGAGSVLAAAKGVLSALFTLARSSTVDKKASALQYK
jgi:hypothetical protein